jgi:ubiquinone/menaquinone biosynthesis C-methylase UbiE
MKRQEYTDANRQAWNETAPVHASSQMDGLLKKLGDLQFLNLDKTAQGWLAKVGVQGKDVVQLCCNNGRELISIRRMGAKRCVGVDISEAFIAQAEQLNTAAGADCTFLACDVYAVPAEYDARFDLVYISIGVLGWLPDLAAFLAVCARLLRPDGQLLIYEMHPILDMIDNMPNLPPALNYSYFLSEPLAEDSGLDYYEGKEYQSSTSYWFHHKLADIIQGCLDQGFILTGMAEYPHDISEVFAYLEKMDARLPLSYVLSARLGREE